MTRPRSWRSAILAPFVICEASGRSVACRGAPAQDGALRDFVVELATELLVPEATAFTRPTR